MRSSFDMISFMNGLINTGANWTTIWWCETMGSILLFNSERLASSLLSQVSTIQIIWQYWSLSSSILLSWETAKIYFPNFIIIYIQIPTLSGFCKMTMAKFHYMNYLMSKPANIEVKLYKPILEKTNNVEINLGQDVNPAMSVWRRKEAYVLYPFTNSEFQWITLRHTLYM